MALIAAMNNVRTKMTETERLCDAAKTMARFNRLTRFGSGGKFAALSGIVDACATLSPTRNARQDHPEPGAVTYRRKAPAATGANSFSSVAAAASMDVPGA
jgi:hypothetical protein